ncbi:hypothetical protein JTB14_016686 [Gonioctena quinquepunctata]|nr:hypothetical protein JTB14_016686 [Gonioctena quinquepunctata]
MDDNSWETSDKNVYYPFRLELTNLGPILLRNNRIVIPVSQRQQILTLAHEGHPGETVMKRRLRAKVWWPLIDRQVEQFVKHCRDCLLVSRPENHPPMARHSFPKGPWECLAMSTKPRTSSCCHILLFTIPKYQVSENYDIVCYNQTPGRIILPAWNSQVNSSG